MLLKLQTRNNINTIFNYNFLISIFFIIISNFVYADIVLRDFKGEILVSSTKKPFQDMPLYRTDEIETLDGGKVMLLLHEKISLYLGEKTRIAIESADDKQVIVKIFSGLVRINELKPLKYQIKTTSAFLTSNKKLSQYYISTQNGQTDYICSKGELEIFEYKLNYDATIPNGFITTKRKGLLVPSNKKSSILIKDKRIIEEPLKPFTISNQEISYYEQATKIADMDMILSEDSIYSLISYDTPLPVLEFDKLAKTKTKQPKKIIVKLEKKKPRIWNPESTNIFDINENNRDY